MKLPMVRWTALVKQWVRNGPNYPIVGWMPSKEWSGRQNWKLQQICSICTRSADIDEINQEMETLFGKQAAQEELDTTVQGMPTGINRKPSAPEQQAASDTFHSNRGKLTHIDHHGHFNMVDTSAKKPTKRIATASAKVCLENHVFELVAQDKLKKGNVLSIAEIAGIQAAKRTSDLIPLCHNIPLSKVDVECKLKAEDSQIVISSTAQTHGTTGVEMEALTAVSVAALTIYDMCKAASKGTVISDISLERKSGGKSGDFNKGDNT